VRELRSVIKRAVTLADEKREALWVEDLGTRVMFIGQDRDASSDLSLESMERRHVERVLKMVGYNKSRAAEALSISRPTLDKKIQDYGIQFPKEP
jgi:transcriptional regulator with PAS, ATPase and Fis domain